MSKSTIPLVEFLKNRIYLGAYDYTPADTQDLVYFTVEETLLFNNFHLDFGPLHIGHLYRFAVILHNILNEDVNQGKAVVFYSSTSPKERANSACLLCCYMILIQLWSPHQVLQPIAQIEPPLQSFRDAGYSNADFEITIQDIVYGMWRAKERGMIDLTNFNLEEYEQYEKVDQGDFNAVSKDFIAFASPQQQQYVKKSSAYLIGPGLNEPFKKVLNYFIINNIQLVVRLNSHLYDANEFTKRGIQHIDMIFDDGTCPTIEYVQKFIGAAECVISKGGKIAVHCKAGLGRTGCLIGAHLIYTHGFTANECIAYMRMIRPGMVVGPQQHWLYLHQNEFRDWRHTMCLDNRPDAFIGGLYPLTSYDDFKFRMKQEAKQRKLQHHQQINSSNIDSSFQTPIRRRKISGALAAKIQIAVPNESPGQPRKYHQEEGNISNMSNHINNSDVEKNDKEDDEEQQENEHDAEVETGTILPKEISNSRRSPSLRTSSPTRASSFRRSPGSDRPVDESLGEIERSPRRDHSGSQDWKVLRTISVNNENTSSGKSSRTPSTSSPPHSSNNSGHGSIKLPKSRSSSTRVSSGNHLGKSALYRSPNGIKKIVSGSGRKI